MSQLIVACGLLGICSCSRNDSDKVAELRAELDAARAEAATAKAELAKLKASPAELDAAKQASLRSPPRLLSGGAPSLGGAGPGKPVPQVSVLQWQEGLTVLIAQEAWARTSCSGDFYSQSGGVWDAAGDQRYEWRLQTPDGKTGTFRIVPGKEHDLSKGAVFVIKASGDKVEVHQLARQLPNIPLGTKPAEEYIKNDTVIRKILGAPGGP
jgi:hypothetical protein